MNLSLADIKGEFREGGQRRQEVRSGMVAKTANKRLIGLSEANRLTYVPINELESALALTGAGKGGSK